MFRYGGHCGKQGSALALQPLRSPPAPPPRPAGDEDGACVGQGPPSPSALAAVVVVTFNRWGPPLRACFMAAAGPLRDAERAWPTCRSCCMAHGRASHACPCSPRFSHVPCTCHTHPAAHAPCRSARHPEEMPGPHLPSLLLSRANLTTPYRSAVHRSQREIPGGDAGQPVCGARAPARQRRALPALRLAGAAAARNMFFFFLPFCQKVRW